MTKRNTSLIRSRRLILSLVALGLIASPLQGPVAFGQPAPAGVTVAPNLMVILGNVV